jgi:pyruvate formate lyase activating enzyme
MDSLMSKASPLAIAEAALKLNVIVSPILITTPVIFHEYAIDTAQACRSLGIKSVAVSAGYVCEQPRAEFYKWMDAANIDLKAFSERFYQQITVSHLQSVLETLIYIKHETSTWLELTTLLIPDENDSEAELEAMTLRVVKNLGHDVPMHFTAFHPDWKMPDKLPTPTATLLKAQDIALKKGVHYAYIGNVHNKSAESTYCHGCGQPLIVRDWYELSDWNIDDSGCSRFCGKRCAGVFKPKPGDWGAKRQTVIMPN